MQNGVENTKHTNEGTTHVLDIGCTKAVYQALRASSSIDNLQLPSL
jgi:hypothetical protein